MYLRLYIRICVTIGDSPTYNLLFDKVPGGFVRIQFPIHILAHETDPFPIEHYLAYTWDFHVENQL